MHKFLHRLIHPHTLSRALTCPHIPLHTLIQPSKPSHDLTCPHTPFTPSHTITYPHTPLHTPLHTLIHPSHPHTPSYTLIHPYTPSHTLTHSNIHAIHIMFTVSCPFVSTCYCSLSNPTLFSLSYCSLSLSLAALFSSVSVACLSSRPLFPGTWPPSPTRSGLYCFNYRLYTTYRLPIDRLCTGSGHPLRNLFTLVVIPARHLLEPWSTQYSIIPRP